MTLALAGVWAWLKARGLRGLIITGLVVLACFQQVQLYGLTIAPRIGPFHFTLIHVEGAVARAASAKAALVARVAAERVARAAQVAVNHAPAQASRAIAEESKHAAPAYHAQLAAAVGAYAAAHPVPQCLRANPTAAGNTSGEAGLPGANHATPVDDGPAGSTGMVAVTRPAFDQLTKAAGRLAEVYRDSWALIARGAAVALPEAQSAGANSADLKSPQK